MGCRSCNRNRKSEIYDVMGGHKYLPTHQIKARLETYKRLYCKECDHRYNCDFVRYNKCTVRPK